MINTLTFDPRSSDEESDDIPIIVNKKKPEVNQQRRTRKITTRVETKKITLEETVKTQESEQYSDEIVVTTNKKSEKPKEIQEIKIESEKTEEKSHSEHKNQQIEESKPVIDTENTIIEEKKSNNYQISYKYSYTGILVTYRIIRKKVRHIYGNSILFTFFKGETQLFSSKFISKYNYIPITDELECHFKETVPIALLIVDYHLDQFSLRKESVTGCEIASIKFSISSEVRARYRRMITYIYADNDAKSCYRFSSSTPTGLQNEYPFYDFEGRRCLGSIKNNILHEQTKKKPCFYFRKIDDDIVDVDVRCDVDPIFIFAMGIANFISKICSLDYD